MENKSFKQLLTGQEDGEIIPDDYNFFNVAQGAMGSPGRQIISENQPSKLVNRIDKPTPT